MKKIEISIPEGYTEKMVTDNNGKIAIEFIKNDKNEEMKEFLLSWINGCTVDLNVDFPDSIFYKKDGEVIFEIKKFNFEKTSYFLVDYDKIWSAFDNKLNLNFDDTQSFIKNVVEDALKLESVKPHFLGVKENLGNGITWYFPS